VIARGLLVASLLAAAAAVAAPPPAKQPASLRSGHVNVARLAGSVNPATSDYLQRAIEHSENDGAATLVIELDTPGGLVASTKDIIQAMLNARVPIVVYVSPQGAWAGSAGTFITMAGHVAAMAPGSSIGAAHPVGIGGGGAPEQDEKGEKGPSDYSDQKAENLLAAFIESIAKERGRNVEWAEKAVRESVAVTADEAVELRVVDLVASDRGDLLRKVAEREVRFQGAPVRLDVANAEQRQIEMDLVTRLLSVIVDPNVAVLLLLAGLLGLYVEFNQPGMLVPGIAGAVCLILALIAMQVLPFSWLGILLIIAGIGLFAAEVFVTSYGLLFAAGVACFLVGGSMLFDRPDVSDLNVAFWPVLVPAVAALSLFGAIVVFAVGRSLRRRQESGVSEMVGMLGRAATPLDPEGTVAIRGEFWHARADEPIAEGERVEAVAVEGLELRVRRAAPR
jgi:membrane-bound serine protease (ClpP class)